MGWRQVDVVAPLVIIYGTGLDTGLFLYNGNPQQGGTLLASITEASTDPFGTATQPGGLAVYNGAAYILAHVNASVGAPAIEMVTGVASETAHASLYTAPANTGGVNELMETWLGGPASTDDSVRAMFTMSSSAKDGSSAATGFLLMNDILGAVLTTNASWNYNGFTILAGTVTAEEPGTGGSKANPALAESWHSLSLTTVTASGNGVNGFRYKLMPMKCLLLEWDLATNSVGNSVTVATLPAGWRPATAHNIGTGTYGGATGITTGANPHFTVNTNGTIVTGGFPAVAFDVFGTALIGLD